MRVIRLLLVDDSPLALMILKRVLAAAPDIEVVGTARHGKEALELLPQLKPDVLCTDLTMPVMDGLELTREVMATSPLPIVVCSSSIERDAVRTYPVLEAGALEVQAKPLSNSQEELTRVGSELAAKVRVLSGVRVFARRPRQAGVPPAAPPAAAPRPIAPASAVALSTVPTAGAFAAPGPRRASVVVIGASTGGPLVLRSLFEALPASFGVPILCVQHIAEGFLAGLIEWLSHHTRLKLGVARPGETLLPGTVRFPVEGSHLEIDAQGRLVASSRPPVDGHRPSVTVTMEAAARQFGSRAVGVLLTGMGADGATGLKAISEAGGVTVAQDEASCTVFGMPKQAIQLGAARYVLSPEEIAGMLARLQPLAPN